MQLRQLEVANWCQHGARTVNFADGLTAVLGPNGSGKSNLLNAVRFAITGVNANAGKGEANLRQQMGETERSFVRLTFSHGDVTAIVTRNLKPTRPTATLEIAGQPVVTGAEAVTAAITQILGLTVDVLNQIVLVGQTDLFGFLSLAATERDGVFQRLFQTERAGQIYTLVTAALKRVPEPRLPVDAAALQQQLSELALLSTRLASELSQQPEVDCLHASIDETQRLRSGLDRVEWLRSHEQQVQASLQQASAQYGELTAGEASAHIAEDRQRNELQQLESLLPAANQVLRQRNAAAATAETYNRLQATLGTLTRAAGDVRAAEPRPPAELSAGYEPGAAATAMNALREQQTYYGTLLATFQAGVAACPVCKTPTLALSGLLDEARSRLPQITADLAVWQQQAAAFQKHTQAVSWWRSMLVAADAQVATATNSLAAAAVPVAADDTAAIAATGTVAQHQQAVLSYRAVYAAAAAATARVGAASQAVSQANLLLSQAQQELRAHPTYPDRSLLDVSVVALREQLARRQQIELEHVAATSQAGVLQQQLVLAVTAAVEDSKHQQWRGTLQALQDLMHSSALPRAVAQRNLQIVETAVNDHLELFGSDFQVTARDGLSFTARFIDGREQPAERLSAGQKVVLALSFRLAVNLLSGSNIGLLVLDEPTAFLDEQHIRGFEPVLLQLRTLAASRGLQCVMVTHEAGLAPLFDQVIDLGAQ